MARGAIRDYNSRMARGTEQYRTWLELIGDLLQQPLGTPWQYDEPVLDLLTLSFNGACSTRNCVSTEWVDRLVASWPLGYLPDEPPGDDVVPDAARQPLLRWYAVTGHTEPQSLGRVPDTVASSRLKGAWEEIVRPWGANNELSIPVQWGGAGHQAYVISRPDRDFNDEELALARLLQPILKGLALHLELAPSNGEASADCCAHGLTGREMTILMLLSKGLTAESLARRLDISPRTAGKHLEHIYRKFDVSDRLMAVQRGRDLGLLESIDAHDDLQ